MIRTRRKGTWRADVKRDRERGFGGFSKRLVGAVVGGFVDEDGGKTQIVSRIAWRLNIIVWGGGGVGCCDSSWS